MFAQLEDFREYPWTLFKSLFSTSMLQSDELAGVEPLSNATPPKEFLLQQQYPAEIDVQAIAARVLPKIRKMLAMNRTDKMATQAYMDTLYPPRQAATHPHAHAYKVRRKSQNYSSGRSQRDLEQDEGDEDDFEGGMDDEEAERAVEEYNDGRPGILQLRGGGNTEDEEASRILLGGGRRRETDEVSSNGETEAPTSQPPRARLKRDREAPPRRRADSASAPPNTNGPVSPANPPIAQAVSASPTTSRLAVPLPQSQSHQTSDSAHPPLPPHAAAAAAYGMMPLGNGFQPQPGSMMSMQNQAPFGYNPYAVNPPYFYPSGMAQQQPQAQQPQQQLQGQNLPGSMPQQQYIMQANGAGASAQQQQQQQQHFQPTQMHFPITPYYQPQPGFALMQQQQQQQQQHLQQQQQQQQQQLQQHHMAAAAQLRQSIPATMMLSQSNGMPSQPVPSQVSTPPEPKRNPS